MADKSIDKLEVANRAPGEDKPVQRRPARRSSVTGPRNVLKASKNLPGHVLRVVNDVGDRVEAFKEMGYEVVDDPDIRIGDRRAGKAGSVGTAVTVNVGQGTKAVLMKQRLDYYEEDQKAKQEQVNSDEDAMYQRARQKESDYGSLKIGQRNE